MRYESPHIPRNVPFLCWDQDNLPCMRTPEATASLNAFTYVAGHGAIYGYTFLRWSETNLVFCQPVGATFRYSGAPAAPENLARYACDISFISNASGAPEQIRDQQRAAWQNAPAAAALYHHVSALVLDAMDAGGSWDYWSLHDAIEQAAAAHGVRLNTSAKQEMIMALTLLSDRCFRHAALQWVSRWCEKTGRTLRLYGRGWENHPAYARYAAGYAPQGAELAAIYQASTINLHLMETGGFLHSRPLDGLAAGGFFLTRTSPNDGFHPRHGPAQITLAERAQVLGLRTRADLDACTDPAVVHAWSIMRRFFTDLRPDERFAGFTLWRELPTACVLFPQLADLTFSTAERFEALAEKYLADENARQSTAHAMRSIVLRELSYTRRWQQFLEGITHGLGAAAKEPAVPLSAAAAVPCTVG
jgi:hypothetical protein